MFRPARPNPAFAWSVSPLEGRTLLSTNPVNIVKDINPIDISPLDLTVAGGKLFFLTEDQVSHQESLWATDGTSAGTIELATGAIFGSDWLLSEDPLNFLVPFGDKIYFLDDAAAP